MHLRIFRFERPAPLGAYLILEYEVESILSENCDDDLPEVEEDYRDRPFIARPLMGSHRIWRHNEFS